MGRDEIKRFKYGADTWAFVHLMFMLTCRCNRNVHQWSMHNLRHYVLFKGSNKNETQSICSGTTTTKGSFSHASILIVVACN